MTIRKLDRREWKSYFDRISKELEAEEAEIEVVSLGLGDQIEAEWLPLLGISYDPKEDVLDSRPRRSRSHHRKATRDLCR
jgi:hypothetical protein